MGMNVNLTPQLEELVRAKVSSGLYTSATEVIDSSTPQGRLLFHLVSAFAEFERGVLIERTKAGLEAARRRGAKIGRPRVNVDVARVPTRGGTVLYWSCLLRPIRTVRAGLPAPFASLGHVGSLARAPKRL